MSVLNWSAITSISQKSQSKLVLDVSYLKNLKLAEKLEYQLKCLSLFLLLKVPRCL